MKKTLKINLDIYSLVIEFCFDPESFEKLSGYKPSGQFLTIEDSGRKGVLIYVQDEWGDFTNPKYLQCLTHECNHAAMIVLGWSGVKFNYKNQEALCYLQDFIFRKCYEFCLKTRKAELNQHQDKPSSPD